MKSIMTDGLNAKQKRGGQLPLFIEDGAPYLLVFSLSPSSFSFSLFICACGRKKEQKTMKEERKRIL